MVRSITQLTRVPLRLQHRVLSASPSSQGSVADTILSKGVAPSICGRQRKERASPHRHTQIWKENLLLGSRGGVAAASLRGVTLERDLQRVHCAGGSWCLSSGSHGSAVLQSLLHSTSPSGSPPTVIPEEPEGDDAPQTLTTTTEGDRGGGNPSVAPHSSQMEVQVLKALEKSLGCKLGHGPVIPDARPLVIIISGPSGVGKDAVIKRLQEKKGELHFVVTATTRPRRPGEVDGQDYFFVSHDEFREMIAANELLEHAIVYGDYKGIPKQQVRDCMARGMDVVVRVDVQGAATLRTMLGNDAVFIFLVAESEVALVRRLVERKTETMEKILVRVATARDETRRVTEFDYVVVNRHGEIDQTVDAITAIINAEKSRVNQRNAKL